MRGRIVRCGCVMLTLVTTVAWGWTDPAGDFVPHYELPDLDILQATVDFEPTRIRISLQFNSAYAQSSDLEMLSGFIDFDTDMDVQTGTESHIADLGPPIPPLGVDYYLMLYPMMYPDHFAELVRVYEGQAYTVNYFPIYIDGMTAVIEVDRCAPEEFTGIAISPNFAAAIIASNGYGEATDRMPNDDNPLIKAGLCDFDTSGLVNTADLDYLESCTTGAHVQQSDPDCDAADLDDDGDVDQDDFGIFQCAWTG